MKLLLVVFALCVGMIFSEEERLHKTVFTKEPFVTKKPCCLPKKFEALMSETVVYYNEKQSVNGIIRYSGKVAIDSDNQKVASNFQVIQNNISNLTITIVDYSKHVMYLAYPATQTCTKTIVKGPMVEQCVPPNSTYLGTGQLGYGNPNSMSVDAWNSVEQKTTPEQMDVATEFQVTPDSCIPVLITGGSMSSGANVVFYAEFINASPTIKDPGMFTPPSYCKSATVIPWEVAKMNSMVASFTKRFNKV